MKSLKFDEFLLEYSKFDGIDKSLTEDGSEMSPAEKEEWKRGIDSDIIHANYQLALDYAKNFLTNYGSAKGGYNSAQAQTVLDRTERKFGLTPAQRSNLEVDIFDWENRDNDDMNAGVEESAEYRFSPRNMKNYIERIWHSGRRHAQKYHEFTVPMQK